MSMSDYGVRKFSWDGVKVECQKGTITDRWWFRFFCDADRAEAVLELLREAAGLGWRLDVSESGSIARERYAAFVGDVSDRDEDAFERWLNGLVVMS
jgi:hypothetical protein